MAARLPRRLREWLLLLLAIVLMGTSVSVVLMHARELGPVRRRSPLPEPAGIDVAPTTQSDPALQRPLEPVISTSAAQTAALASASEPVLPAQPQAGVAAARELPPLPRQARDMADVPTETAAPPFPRLYFSADEVPELRAKASTTHHVLADELRDHAAKFRDPSSAHMPPLTTDEFTSRWNERCMSGDTKNIWGCS